MESTEKPPYPEYAQDVAEIKAWNDSLAIVEKRNAYYPSLQSLEYADILRRLIAKNEESIAANGLLGASHDEELDQLLSIAKEKRDAYDKGMKDIANAAVAIGDTRDARIPMPPQPGHTVVVPENPSMLQ